MKNTPKPQPPSGHWIVVGYGEVGRRVTERLMRQQAAVVVIERNAQRAQQVRQRALTHGASELTVVEADAFHPQTLTAAAVERAAGLALTLDSDRDNLVLCVKARRVGGKLRVVARADAPSSVSKLLRVGADATANPTELGGVALASMMCAGVKLASAEPSDLDQRFATIDVHRDGACAGSSLGSFADTLADAVTSPTDARVIGLSRSLGRPYTSPPPWDVMLQGGASVLVQGSAAGLLLARRLMGT